MSDAVALCLACLGHGKKCKRCSGKGYVSDAASREAWGTAFPGHMEGKKFVLDYGGSIPHIPDIEHSAKHERLRSKRLELGVDRSMDEYDSPEDDGSGVTRNENGVFIHADTAEMKAVVE